MCLRHKAVIFGSYRVPMSDKRQTIMQKSSPDRYRGAFARGFRAGLAAPALLVSHATLPVVESTSTIERAWRNVGGYVWDAVRKERRRHGDT